MSPACAIKPTPIVMTFSMSFSTTARKNSNTRPDQRNATTSRPGTRSDSPVISARRVGMVAQCNTMAANQPRVSAEIRCRWLLRKSRTVCRLKGQVFKMLLHKKCDVQFCQFWACANWAELCHCDSTWPFSYWAV